LVREKRVVGLIIASLVAAITAITTMAMASMALSQSIHNAHYINMLTQNVTYTLQQVSIDEKIDVYLNILEVALLTMGHKLQTIKFRQALLCHAGFQHICITAAPCNESEYPWQSIKVHVMGAWENSNDTLNLQHLRQQILAMQRAYDQVISPADMAKTILDELQGFNPFNVLKHAFWYLIGIGVLLLICFCVFSVRSQALQRQFLRLSTSL
jgi:hypothetical protein